MTHCISHQRFHIAHRLLLACLPAILLVGCQPQAPSPTPPTPQASAPASSPAVAKPARFEVRDFKLEEDSKTYGTSVKGRGTLLALDDELKKGNFLVWLTMKAEHRDAERFLVLILHDGLATIETNDFLSESEKDKVKVRYTDWKITGYVRFQDAVVVNSGAASAPQK